MPINPSIPLGVQPIQVNNPVQDWGQAINVADLIQRRQANQMLMQERMIDMQAKQRALDAQNTMGQLIAQHTTVAPDGAVSVDHDAVKLGLAQKGYTPELFKYDNDLRANLKAQRDAQEAQNKVHAQQAERLGNLAIGILQAPKEVRPEAYKAALRQAAHEGLIPVTAAEQAIAQGYTPDTESQVQQWVNSSPAIKSYIDVQREAREQQTASLLGEQHKATTAKLNAEIPEAKAKAEQAQMNTFGQRAQAAQTQADWDKLRADYPQFNVPALFSSQAAKQVAQKYGETPNQLATREQAAANAANTERHQKVLEQYTAERVGLMRQRLNNENKENARSLSADRRQAYSEAQKLEQQEDEVNAERARLGPALAQGNSYIPPKGGPAVPLDVAARQAANSRSEADLKAAKQSLIDDMQARYNQTTPRLKRIIADKYNQYGRLGVTPTVPLEDVQKALDAGDVQTRTSVQQRENPPAADGKSAPVPPKAQPPAPPPTPKPTATPQQAKPNAASQQPVNKPAATQQPQTQYKKGDRARNPKTGQTIQFDGQQWVDESTGKPLQ